MDDSGNASYKVSVTGLPKKYGLDRAKNIIGYMNTWKPKMPSVT